MNELGTPDHNNQGPRGPAGPVGQLPPAYGGCTCSCHRNPGVVHVVACCFPSDERPEDDLEVVVPAPVAPANTGEPLVVDDPLLDGTDLAHPAWWRGHDRGVAQVCHRLREILDGAPAGGVAADPFQGLKERIKRLLDGDTQPLNRLANEVSQINAANGWPRITPEDWENDYRVLAVLMLITTEVAEAAEDFRHGRRAHFDEEIADIVIRCMDLAAGLGIDLDASVRAKLEKNKTRGYRHGGKRV